MLTKMFAGPKRTKQIACKHDMCNNISLHFKEMFAEPHKFKKICRGAFYAPPPPPQLNLFCSRTVTVVFPNFCIFSFFFGSCNCM